ncbi:MAG: EF-hand domain-containing protein [Deltaproteobacteria bacterium]|nr:EF-hand domain-containing protein [Deltaproteobacteria bacterium]
MTTSGISSSNSSLQAWQAMMQQRKQDLSQIATALQGGDLASAQKSFADLQSLNQDSSQAQNNAVSSIANSGETTGNDFSSLGQALNSGNLTDAQSAFSKVLADMQTQKASHHGHHGHAMMQQREQDFSQLGAALQSGDLASAQKAFADLQSLKPGGQAQDSTGSSTGNSGNAISNDFASLGQALGAGNLIDAQSAFKNMQSDMQAQKDKAAAAYAANSGGDSLSSLIAGLQKLVEQLQAGSGDQGTSTATASVGHHHGGHHGLQEFFKKVDTDGSGGVFMDELSAMANKVQDKTGQSITVNKDTFAAADGNGDGSLNADELKAFMTQSGFTPPSHPEGMATAASSDATQAGTSNTKNYSQQQIDLLKIMLEKLTELSSTGSGSTTTASLLDVTA